MSDRAAMTIRFPPDLLARAREVKLKGESMNEFLVELLSREVRRREGMKAFEAGVRLHDRLKAEGGLQPDSTPYIRSLREGDRSDE
ncbi:MAG: YlcI/YnfO family protein [Dehalococcoidia bacterium]